jgi:glycosyltransferase involved in cell wall biosynthesis
MKKVLYVFGGEEASGAEYVIQRLIQNNQQEVEAHLFVSPGKFAEDAIRKKVCKITLLTALKKLNRGRNKGIGFIATALKNYITVSVAVLRYINRNKISIVHANTIVPASYLLPAIIFSKLTLKKTIWLWSDHDIRYFSRIDHFISKCCVKLYSVTLVVSNAVKEKFSLNTAKLVVLYNGLDLNEFKVDNVARLHFREKHNIKPDDILFCIAGVVSPRKGQVMFIKVFSELLTKYDNIKLIFAGSLSEDTPEYYSKFLSDISYFKDKITYIGKVSDMVPLYNGIDILFNNSSKQGSEPLGTTILEAMATRKIVVVSKVGGSPEIVTNLKSGFLFEPDNETALKTVMEYVITNISSLDNVKTNARLTIANNFDIKIMAHNYNQIIANSSI